MCEKGRLAFAHFCNLRFNCELSPPPSGAISDYCPGEMLTKWFICFLDATTSEAVLEGIILHCLEPTEDDEDMPDFPDDQYCH